MGNIELAVEYAVQIANDNTHGYDQTNRLSPDYDCSSLISSCLAKAGFNISPSSTTFTMVKQLLACGFVAIPINSARQSGDIFIHEEHHVIMCVSADKVVYASSNEFGGVTGGQTGDQTGNEIKVANFYTPSYGWTHHLRYEGVNEEKKLNEYTIKKGDINDIVAVFQSLLVLRGFSVGTYGIDGEYGDDTENARRKALEQYRLDDSDLVDSKMWDVLINGMD